MHANKPTSTWIEKFFDLLFPPDWSSLRINDAYALKAKFIPKFLYKYRPVRPYTIENLEDNTIWLSSPMKFNDPYDSAMTADIERVIKRNFVKQLTPNLTEKYKIPKDVLENALKSLEPLSVLLDWLATTGQSVINPQNVNALKKTLSAGMQIQCDMLREKVFLMHFENAQICSLTTNPDSLLMWGHYADQHKGFCIEYKTDGVDPIHDLRLRLLYPVRYSNELTDSSFIFEQTSGVVMNNLAPQRALLNKSSEWAYEKEWRVVISGILKADMAWKFLYPSAIYLGAKISIEHEKQLVQIADAKGISVLKMGLSMRRYELMSRPIVTARVEF